jgi:hypothetical protein
VSPQVAAGVYLFVSVESLAVHATVLARLARLDVRPRGVARTVACRVVAQLAALGLGGYALAYPAAGPVGALCVLCAVSIMWQVNSAADWRLRRATQTSREHR